MVSANPFNVFITGATTPLGRELTRQLSARGHRVTGLTDGSANAALVRQDGGIPAFVTDPFRVGELKSVLGAAQAEVVLHLTPQLINGFPWRGLPWDATLPLVSEGTMALVRAAEQANNPYFIYPSFAFLYGDQHGEWVDETTPSHTKALFRPALNAENYVLNSPIAGCVMRAGTIYGPEEPGTAAVIEALKRGHSLYTGDVHACANWVYFSDLAAALVLAAERRPAKQLLNVVDEQPAPPAEWVAYLAQTMGLPVPPQPRNLALRPAATPVQTTLLSQSVQVRNGRAKETLGWLPRFPTYRAGLDAALLVERAGISAR